MSKELTIDNTLDSHLKPLKIDDKLTGLEISEEELVVRTKTRFDSSLSSEKLISPLKIASDNDSSNFFTVTTDTDGATSLVSSDSLALGSNGAMTLDSRTGAFSALKNNTEFSVANSAYAGMILGFQMIGEDESHQTYTLTTSYAVPTSAMNVKFVAPPSGNVEITVQIEIDDA